MKPFDDAVTLLTRFPRVFPVNCYLVREDDGLTLIDTGIPGNAPAILAAAGELGQPIRRIVLIHAHGAHLGALDALHQLLADAEVWKSSADQSLGGNPRLTASFVAAPRTSTLAAPLVP